MAKAIHVKKTEVGKTQVGNNGQGQEPERHDGVNSLGDMEITMGCFDESPLFPGCLLGRTVCHEASDFQW